MNEQQLNDELKTLANTARELGYTLTTPELFIDPKEIGTAKRTKTPAKKKEANTSMKKPIIATVVITLAVVAAFAATFAAGMNYANSLHDQREAAVKAATIDLKAQTPQAQ